jgi:plasmid maintenance system antidote protein VapI
MTESKILSNVNDVTRNLINSYIQKNGITLNAFSKLVGINQAILFKFVNYKKNVSTKTIEKVGKFFNQ